MADGKWQGTDADLETSLFEYNFVAKQRAGKDHPDEWFVLYKMGNNAFGTGHIRESELDALINGKEWMKEEDIKRTLDYVGQTKEEWLKGGFINKLSDLLGYWGNEEIMGSDYNPLDKKGALKMMGIEGEENESVVDRDKLISKADDILSDYDFGEGVADMEHGAWQTEDLQDLTKMLYVTFDDDPDADSTKISFHVRFTKEGKVEDAYALDFKTGADIGQRGDKVDESKARKLIEELKFTDGPGSSESSDIIDDKLNREVTILQGVLAKKGLGDKASFQTANGAMINILALGAKSEPLPAEEEEPKAEGDNKGDDKKDEPSPAARVIGAASNICATEAKDLYTKPTQYLVSFDKGKKDDTLGILKKMDPGLAIDKEGNPSKAWIQTVLPLRHIIRLDGVEDAVPSKGGKFNG